MTPIAVVTEQVVGWPAETELVEMLPAAVIVLPIQLSEVSYLITPTDLVVAHET